MKKDQLIGSWSPWDIETILHIHSLAAPLNDCSILHERLEQFRNDSLIKPDSGRACGYSLTDRGNMLVEMWKNTPLPVYADPRSLKSQ